MSTLNEQQKLLSIVLSNWPQLTELDKRLISMAVMNPVQFKALIGEDAITRAKTCLLRQENKSYGEISHRLNITYKQARYGCKDCNEGKESSIDRE